MIILHFFLFSVYIFEGQLSIRVSLCPKTIFKGQWSIRVFLCPKTIELQFSYHEMKLLSVDCMYIHLFHKQEKIVPYIIIIVKRIVLAPFIITVSFFFF